MAVWFLAPIAFVGIGAKYAWDHFNQDEDDSSNNQSHSNTKSSTESQQRYCDINTVIKGVGYPAVETAPALAQFKSAKLSLGQTLLNKIASHLQGFYALSALKKCQIETLAASIALHESDTTKTGKRLLEINSYSRRILNLVQKINTSKEDLSRYMSVYEEVAGTTFQKMGNWFNSDDRKKAELYEVIADKERTTLKELQHKLCNEQEYLEKSERFHEQVKAFDIESAKAAHAYLNDEITKLDNAFKLGVEQLVEQLSNVTFISEHVEIVGSLLEKLNSSKLQSTLDMKYIEQKLPTNPIISHSLVDYCNAKSIRLLLSRRETNENNKTQLELQVKTLDEVRTGFKLLKNDLAAAIHSLPELQSTFNAVHGVLTKPTTEKHELSDVFKEYNAEVVSTLANLDTLPALVKAYEETDFDAKIVFRNDEIAKLQASIVQVTSKVFEIEDKISDHMADVKTLEGEISSIFNDISILEGFNNELANSSNKRLVHEKVEAKYGDGSPRRLIGQFKTRVVAKKRHLQKALDKVNETITGMLVPVSDILIDGSNCCYMGSEFIGLSALKAILPQLSEIAPVNVIFDYGLVHKLKLNAESINQELAMPNVDVFVAPQGEIADNFLNTIADSKPESVIVSNDGFQEFKGDKGRIRNHMITRDRIIIHSLDVSTSY
ncbi:MAG: hypothetical protein WBC60_04115 [Cognaticolwellia sp.]